MKATLKPSEFFSRLKLDALDSATKNYIQEEILPSPNLDVAESSEVLEQIISTIRDNFPEALADMPKDIQEEQVEEVAPLVTKTEEEEVEAPKILKHVRLQNHINAFKSILPLKTGEEKKKIQSYINAFKVTLSITPKDVYADGGKIGDNNYTVLYVKEGKVAEKHFHTKPEATEFAKKHHSVAFKFASGGKVYATYGKHGYKVYKDGTELENVTSDGVDIETIRGNAQERVIHLANQHNAIMGGALSEYEDGGEVGEEYEILKPNETRKEHIFNEEGRHTHTNYYDHEDKISRQKLNNADSLRENETEELVTALADKDSNGYAGKSPEYIWNHTPIKGRLHFLTDHDAKFKERGGADAEHWVRSVMVAHDYNDLPEVIKQVFTEHVSEGQYKYGGTVPTKAQKKKVAKVMGEFKEGELTSHGKVVEDKAQAVAIALNSADLSNKK